MCDHGNTKRVLVNIPASHSYTGKERWDFKHIDKCIADIVDALNRGGVYTLSSCCGHGKCDGSIILQDGRELIIRKIKNE